MRLLIITVIIFPLNKAFCQKDSLALNVDLIFGVDRYFSNANKDIYLPDNIQIQRQMNSGIAHDFRTYTDIPQLHASAFAGALTNLTLSNGYNLHFDLFAEDRGQSFGSLALNKIILFPRIYGSILDTLKLGKQVFSVAINGGDLIRYQHNHGLTINNLDLQGVSVMLTVDQFYFRYSLIADVSQHIGLNITEFYSYGLGYKGERSKWSFDINISFDQYSLFIGRPRNNLTLNTEIQNRRFSLFSESSYNIENQTFATLFGFRHQIKLDRLSFNSHVSYRFYGKSFNQDFTENSVRYRNLSTPTLINNSVGDFLYPLINNYRPFDQWSVYTEYSEEQLHSAKVAVDTEYNISKKLFCFLDYEGLLIEPSSVETAYYNFFESGIGYRLPARSIIKFYVTNKLMNLDVHYQTFYQSIKPVFGFSIRRLLDYQ